jgi:hypothetical protein
MTLILSGTVGLSDVDGSAATPAIRGTDTNTGIFFPAADTIAFAEGGVEAMRLDASGNMGLGVTPSAWAVSAKALQIGGFVALANFTDYLELSSNSVYDGAYKYLNTGRAAASYAQTAGTHRWFSAPSGTAGNTITFTQAMTLDASGNLGVGTTSPSYRLDISAASSNNAVTAVRAGSGYASVVAIAGNGTTPLSSSFDLIQDGTNAYIYQRANAPIIFGTNNTERARIDSSGNLLVGTTSASINSGEGTKLLNDSAKRISTVSSLSSNGGGETYVMYSTGAAAYRFYVGWGGTIYATSTTITGLSDQRLKENIRDLDEGLDVVMALKPRKFDWKEGKGAGTKDARGFIAQEFEAVLPDMIDEWKDPAPEGEEPYKSVNANLIPTLVKAIQELKAEFDAYKLTHP